jgi:hypothetical protein
MRHFDGSQFIITNMLMDTTVTFTGTPGTHYIAWIYSGGLVVSVDQASSAVPEGFVLYQSYPNPFNSKTVISYELRVKSEVRLGVYDVLGCEVATLADGNKDAGAHQVMFNAAGLTSSVYFYRLQVAGAVEVKRMIVLR